MDVRTKGIETTFLLNHLETYRVGNVVCAGYGGERRRKSGKRYLSVHTRIRCHMFNFNMMNRSHGERIFPFSGAVYFPLFCHLPVLSVIFSIAFHPHNILNGFC